ncbi:MAG: tetratricopeptide repeat protein, partial [Candidatus Omnitrophica bacterium]|nr:tetratricopeptide repeat protein [Candidatus Omnitrophota bacterium]
VGNQIKFILKYMKGEGYQLVAVAPQDAENSDIKPLSQASLGGILAGLIVLIGYIAIKEKKSSKLETAKEHKNHSNRNRRGSTLNIVLPCVIITGLALVAAKLGVHFIKDAFIITTVAVWVGALLYGLARMASYISKAHTRENALKTMPYWGKLIAAAAVVTFVMYYMLGSLAGEAMQVMNDGITGILFRVVFLGLIVSIIHSLRGALAKAGALIKKTINFRFFRFWMFIGVGSAVIYMLLNHNDTGLALAAVPFIFGRFSNPDDEEFRRAVENEIILPAEGAMEGFHRIEDPLTAAEAAKILHDLERYKKNYFMQRIFGLIFFRAVNFELAIPHLKAALKLISDKKSYDVKAVNFELGAAYLAVALSTRDNRIKIPALLRSIAYSIRADRADWQVEANVKTAHAELEKARAIPALEKNGRAARVVDFEARFKKQDYRAARLKTIEQLRNKGQDCMTERDFDGAIDYFSRAINLLGRTRWLVYGVEKLGLLLGEATLAKEDYTKAAMVFEETAQLPGLSNVEKMHTLAGLAKAYFSVGNDEELEGIVKQAMALYNTIEASPHKIFTPEFYSSVAKIAYYYAQSLLNSSDEEKIKLSGTLFGLAAEYFQMAGDLVAMDLALRKVKSVDNLVGFSKIEPNHQDKIESLRAELAKNPDDFVAHFNLGQVLFNAGEYREARNEFDKAYYLTLDQETQDYIYEYILKAQQAIREQQAQERNIDHRYGGFSLIGTLLSVVAVGITGIVFVATKSIVATSAVGVGLVIAFGIAYLANTLHKKYLVIYRSSYGYLRQLKKPYAELTARMLAYLSGASGIQEKKDALISARETIKTQKQFLRSLYGQLLSRETSVDSALHELSEKMNKKISYPVNTTYEEQRARLFDDIKKMLGDLNIARVKVERLIKKNARELNRLVNKAPEAGEQMVYSVFSSYYSWLKEYLVSSRNQMPSAKARRDVMVEKIENY